MKKKWHLLHIFHTFDTGGSSVRTCQIINDLGEEYYHTILAMNQNYGAKGHLKSQDNVEYIYDDCFQKPISFFSRLSLFRVWLKKLHPHLMITSNWGAIEWGIANFLFPLCPHIHTEDGFNPDEMEKQKTRRVLIRHSFLKSSVVVLPSHTLEAIALDIWKIPTKNILYIPNGIEWEHFYLPDIFTKPEEIIIGTVCSLRKIKNIFRLVKAFSSLPKEIGAKLWIIGDGEDRENVEKAAKDLCLAEQVCFWGHQDNPAPFYKKMKIFALSSDSEQMPISLLEAMAAGCAVISTDVGDVKNMLPEENKRFLVNRYNEVEYAEKLRELVENPELCRKLGKSNQEKCYQEYRKESMIKNYSNLYQSFLH
ncbi:MAG: glycosyltransferase family 4 protein [Candidatus Brocadiae bacterium]|nr:glycosyltransferase family 4 protein [Candidatus Brocadiia bacterium]